MQIASSPSNTLHASQRKWRRGGSAFGNGPDVSSMEFKCRRRFLSVQRDKFQNARVMPFVIVLNPCFMMVVLMPRKKKLQCPQMRLICRTMFFCRAAYCSAYGVFRVRDWQTSRLLLVPLQHEPSSSAVVEQCHSTSCPPRAQRARPHNIKSKG